MTTLTIYSVLYSFDIHSSIALKSSFTPCLSLRFGFYLESLESPQKLKFLPASARCSLGAHALCAPILRLLFRDHSPYIRCRFNLVLSSALMRIPTLRTLRIARNDYQISINVKKTGRIPTLAPGCLQIWSFLLLPHSDTYQRNPWKKHKKHKYNPLSQNLHVSFFIFTPLHLIRKFVGKN